jgi:hypothetical protein
LGWSTDAEVAGDATPADAVAKGERRHKRIERLMENGRDLSAPEPAGDSEDGSSCRSIDWYSEGQARVIDVNGVRVTVRFVGRRGRRARIAITAPPGAVFSAAEGNLQSDTGERTRPQESLRS